MLVKDLFYIARVDVIRPGENEVLFTVHNGKEPIFVHTRQVARVQPAINQGLSRGLGHIPVTLHHLWPPDQQFPHLAWRQRLARLYIDDACSSAGQWQTDAANAALTLERVAVRDGGGFGESIAFNKVASGELFKGFLHLDWQRCRTTDANADRRNAIASDLRIVGNSEIEGWNARENAGMMLFDCLHHLLSALGGQQDE